MLVDRDNKIAEFDVHLRKKDERCAIMETELRQRVQGEHLNCFLSTRLSMLHHRKKNFRLVMCR